MNKAYGHDTQHAVEIFLYAYEGEMLFNYVDHKTGVTYPFVNVRHIASLDKEPEVAYARIVANLQSLATQHEQEISLASLDQAVSIQRPSFGAGLVSFSDLTMSALVSPSRLYCEPGTLRSDIAHTMMCDFLGRTLMKNQFLTPDHIESLSHLWTHGKLKSKSIKFFADLIQRQGEVFQAEMVIEILKAPKKQLFL